MFKTGQIVFLLSLFLIVFQMSCNKGVEVPLESPEPEIEAGSWKLIGLEGEMVMTIAVHPKIPSIIYTGTGSNFSAGTRGKIYKTTDWGRTWNAILHDVSPTVIVIDQQDPNVIYVGLGTANFTRPGLLKSIDGGLTWSQADSGIDFGVEGINLASLAIDPRDSRILYAGTGGFWPGSLYKSTNAGKSWTDLRRVGRGPAVSALESTVLSIAIDPHNPDVIYVGTTNNLLKSTDGGLTWNYTALREDGMGATCVVVSQHQSDRIYFHSQHGFTRSDDGGRTYLILNTGLPATEIRGIRAVILSSIIEDPVSKGKLFVSAFTGAGHQLYFSNSSGELWFSSIDNAFNRHIIDLQLASNRKYLIAGTENGVYLFRMKR
jgi:photosystem II stability/assembly factor-like uncharacterized protein